MGKKTRIVLLAVTVVIAVFTFGMMWTVRPNANDSVLEAARERQTESLLSVSQPLETDPETISKEEEMAEKVAEILLSDDDFIAAIADKVVASVDINEYIPGITEEVYSRIASDYSSNLESDILALYDKYRDALASDMVDAVVNAYNALTVEAKSDVLSMDEIITLLYERYKDVLVSELSEAIVIDGMAADDVKTIIYEVYENEKDYIMLEAENRILADYNALTTEEKIDVLSLDEQILALYDVYRDALASDMVDAVVSAYNALTVEAKSDVLSMDEIITLLYERYKDVLVSELSEAIVIDGMAADDVKTIIYEIYENEKDYIMLEAENRILADYNALTTEEKIDALSLDDQILALYDVYRDALMLDIIAALPEEERLVADDVEDIIVGMYDANRDYVVNDILSEYPEAKSLSEEELRDIIYTMYDENRDWIISDIDSALEYLSEDDIVAMYDEYAAFIAEDIARRVHGSEAAEASIIEESPAIEEEIPAIEEESPVIEEEISQLSEEEAEEIVEAIEEEIAPPKTPISIPSFTEAVAEDASADDYMAAREARRQEEIAKAFSFIN